MEKTQNLQGEHQKQEAQPGHWENPKIGKHQKAESVVELPRKEPYPDPP